ncbi:MAG: permease [Candidatus Omnitrophica bacterium]|nr:permease [Candidatus Omnitrophota bacterium]
MFDQKLAGIVDIFRCCIFTWGAITTVLPAFLLAGAVASFVPAYSITRFLGPKANKWISFPIASVVGQILPACSCNIVPLFASILKRGCGTGPAFAFLYAGPAINIISIAFIFKIIGPILAFWRIVGVFVISIVIGLTMWLLFRDEKSPAYISSLAPIERDDAIERPKKRGVLLSFFVMLFFILAIGSSIGGLNPLGLKDRFILQKIAIVLMLVAGVIFLLIKYFPKESVFGWLDQVWRLLRSILPILIPSILVIGILSVFIDIRWVHNLFSAQKDALGNRVFLPTLRSTFLATLFGELMYFPILTEVVFVKAFLKLGIDIGPALGILLAGPGTSLPGLILIYKFAGFRKVLAYFTISIIMETIVAVSLSMYIGDYICACLLL